MRTIKIFRKKAYGNSLIAADIMVNEKKKGSLYSNSSIEITSPSEEIEVYAKYLWMRSNKLILDSDKKYVLQVRSRLSDRWFFGNIILIFALYLMAYYTEIPLVETLLQCVAFAFLGVLLFSVSIGKNRYFKLTIENKAG